jgi:small ligand-binding sensory domain FIST
VIDGVAVGIDLDTGIRERSATSDFVDLSSGAMINDMRVQPASTNMQ